MEEYVKQCEKAMQTGKKADLPKVLQSQLQDVQRGMENRGLEGTDPTESGGTKIYIGCSECTTTTTTFAKTILHKEKGVKVKSQKEEV